MIQGILLGARNIDTGDKYMWKHRYQKQRYSNKIMMTLWELGTNILVE